MKEIVRAVAQRLFTLAGGVLAGLGFSPDQIHTILAAFLVFLGVVLDVMLERIRKNG